MSKESDLGRAHAILHTIAADQLVTTFFLKELGYDHLRAPFVLSAVKLVRGRSNIRLSSPNSIVFEGDEKLRERFVFEVEDAGIVRAQAFKRGGLSFFSGNKDGLLPSDKVLDLIVVLSPSLSRVESLDFNLRGWEAWRQVNGGDESSVIIGRRPGFYIPVLPGSTKPISLWVRAARELSDIRNPNAPPPSLPGGPPSGRWHR